MFDDEWQWYVRNVNAIKFHITPQNINLRVSSGSPKCHETGSLTSTKLNSLIWCRNSIINIYTVLVANKCTLIRIRKNREIMSRWRRRRNWHEKITVTKAKCLDPKHQTLINCLSVQASSFRVSSERFTRKDSHSKIRIITRKLRNSNSNEICQANNKHTNPKIHTNWSIYA